MLEFTLGLEEVICIGSDIKLKILTKIHPLAITAQMVRIGCIAPDHVNIVRGELLRGNLHGRRD